MEILYEVFMDYQTKELGLYNADMNKRQWKKFKEVLEKRL